MKIDLSINQEIMAVVTLDDAGLKVARSAAALALKSRRRLRLVTLCDESVTTDRDEQLTSNILREVARQIDARLEVRTSVIDGRFPFTLLELASAQQSLLLIVGQSVGRNDALGHTMELMAGASMPVLVIPETAQCFDFDDSGRLKILIADDLSQSAAVAIDCLSAFINLLCLSVDVLHMHVESVDDKSIVLSPNFELKLWPQLEVRERQLDSRCEKIKNILNDRGLRLSKVVEANGGVYHLELWHGDVFHELGRAAQNHQASIVVFGKHYAIHKSPFSTGQMGYQKMLNMNRPIMMAPAPH